MKKKLEVTTEQPFRDHLSKEDLWRQTISVWDLLVENGYHPADFSTGVVTMRQSGFMKLVEDSSNGVAAIQETRHYRTNSVWIGDIEVSYMEIKNPKEKWLVVNDWKPLSLAILFLLFFTTVTSAEDFYPSISRARSMDEVDRNLYYEYRQRLTYRRLNALELRRQYNANKVHVYYPIQYNYQPFPNFFQAGLVQQPPIPIWYNRRIVPQVQVYNYYE